MFVSAPEGAQYNGGPIMSTVGDIMSTLGDIMSTPHSSWYPLVYS